MRDEWLEWEQRLAARMCRIGPVIAVVTLPLVAMYLLPLIYLQPLRELRGLGDLLWTPALLVCGCFAIAPIVWRMAIAWERRSPSLFRQPIAGVGSVALLFLIAIMLSTTRGSWLFVEWAKIRTPNPSFARNVLFWEQRVFESRGGTGEARIGFVGSSQTYQGFELKTFAQAHPNWFFEKNCLAGFGPMQYSFLLNRLSERRFDVYVCQLSEFDFYREDELPVNRLRWAATLPAVWRLATVLSAAHAWENRGHIADLTLASAVTPWRLRDHFRRTLFGYWWNRSIPPVEERATHRAPRIEPRGIGSVHDEELATAIDNLRRNVGNKRLVEVNFRSFRQFAELLRKDNIRLLVVEGQVHPDARRQYDTDRFQEKARARLSVMADELDFTFVPASAMPTFSEADFSDAYHLNADGARKLSDCVSQFLRARYSPLTRIH